MHDIYYGTALPPFRKPIQILQPSDRIGVPYFHCPPEKIVAVVETNSPDRNTAFKPVDVISQRIAKNLLEFLAYEVKEDACPRLSCPCSRASATSPMPSFADSTMVRSIR